MPTNHESKLYKVEMNGKKIEIPIIPASRLGEQFNYPESSANIEANPGKSLSNWKMELDDSPIFRYLYRNFKPTRHLEFGTWQGTGAVYCLEESSATVWTINLLLGETTSDHKIAYGNYADEVQSLQEWASKIGLPIQNSYQTDSIGFIGRNYLRQNLGNRVCQIYSDSLQWDTSNYPEAFFDSVLIDGGHSKEVVINDTEKAFPLLRSGGLMMWHDFCPPVWEQFEVTKGVMAGIVEQWDWLNENMAQLFWIEPSWILAGIKK